MTDITAKPFDWNDNLSKEAIEDFEGIQKDLPYCTCQNIGMALAKLELLEKQGQELRTGHWILQPSNKEQGERDFIWWKCSKCGQVIFSETEKDRREFHAFCSRCGAKMVEPQERGE